MHRLLVAPAVAATLLLGALTTTSLASAEQEVEQPTAECTAVTQQLAALKIDLQAAIDADNIAGLVEDSLKTVGLKTQVQVTAGLVEEKCAPPVTTEPEPTTPPVVTDPPAPDPDAPLPVYYENCAAAIEAGVAPIVLANGEPGYRPALDSDNDGIACEANESDAGGADPTPGDDNSGTLGGSNSGSSGAIDSTPLGSVDTGYVAG